MLMTLFDDEQIYKAFENDIKQETAKNKAIFMIQFNIFNKFSAVI